jgi:uncharacterized membrane protein (DUF485 family)
VQPSNGKETLMLTVILLVLALIAFVAATFNAPVRFNLVAAGLALWVLAVLIAAGDISINAD